MLMRCGVVSQKVRVIRIKYTDCRMVRADTRGCRVNGAGDERTYETYDIES